MLRYERGTCDRVAISAVGNAMVHLVTTYVSYRLTSDLSITALVTTFAFIPSVFLAGVAARLPERSRSPVPRQGDPSAEVPAAEQPGRRLHHEGSLRHRAIGAAQRPDELEKVSQHHPHPPHPLRPDHLILVTL